MEARVNNAMSALIKIQLGMLLVHVVRLTTPLHLAASISLNVDVMLDTRAEMELHVLRVTLPLIKLDLVCIRVHFVPLVQHLQMAASHPLPVNVTLGIQREMEGDVNSVTRTRTKQHWDLKVALVVRQILSLPLAA